VKKEQEYKEFQANKGPRVRSKCKERRRRFTIVCYVCSGTASNYPRAPIIIVNLPEFTSSLFGSTWYQLHW